MAVQDTLAYLTAEKAGTHLSEDEWTEIQMAVALLRDRILSPAPTEGEGALGTCVYCGEQGQPRYHCYLDAKARDPDADQLDEMGQPSPRLSEERSAEVLRPYGIEQEWQYRITRAQADKLQAELERVRGSRPETLGVHPRLREAELDALASQIADLRRELAEYPTPTEGEQAGTDGEPEQATEIIANTVSEFYASQVMESVIGDAWTKAGYKFGADLHRVCDAAARSVGGK
jgi:hypothetical protein